MMNITKNYGKLVGSVSAAMVDKARGILVEKISRRILVTSVVS